MPKSETAYRPIRVTLLALITLAMALWNGLRLGQAIVLWNILDKYGRWPLYIAISGGLWFLGGIILFQGLWRRKFWSWSLAIGITLLYEFYYWLDRTLVQEQNANWPFALATSIIFLLIIMLILFSPQTRQYFSKRNL